MAETILQHWIFTRFALPFLLVFFIVFAILEKTKIFGSDKKQLNALVAFIIGLVFVTFAYPVMVVSNLILFLTVALVVVFVVLLIWGFISGGESNFDLSKTWAKALVIILIVVAVGIAVLWATGIYSEVYNWLFQQDWSNELWVNISFIVVIAVALAIVLKKESKSS